MRAGMSENSKLVCSDFESMSEQFESKMKMVLVFELILWLFVVFRW